MKTFSVAAVAAAVASAANLRTKGQLRTKAMPPNNKMGMVLHNESGAEITVHYEFGFEENKPIAGEKTVTLKAGETLKTGTFPLENRGTWTAASHLTKVDITAGGTTTTSQYPFSGMGGFGVYNCWELKVAAGGKLEHVGTDCDPSPASA